MKTEIIIAITCTSRDGERNVSFAFPCNRICINSRLIIDGSFCYDLLFCIFLFPDDDRDSCRSDAHFVLEGWSTSVQRLHVHKTGVAFGRERITLVRNGCIRDGPDRTTAYVKMSDFRPGSVFGLGACEITRPGSALAFLPRLSSLFPNHDMLTIVN